MTIKVKVCGITNEKEMKEIDYYITGHTSFLYDRIEDPTIQEIVECTRAIAINNFLYITTKREQNAKIQETITGAKVIESTTTLIQEEQTVKQTTKRAKKDLSEIIELIIYSCLSDELPKILEGISQDDFKQIKLLLETRKNKRKHKYFFTRNTYYREKKRIFTYIPTAALCIKMLTLTGG